jgi:predicted thioesterase
LATDEVGLSPARSAEYTVTASSENVASRFGSVDVAVVATAHLNWLLEGASVRAVKDHLRPGDGGTVGTALSVRHERAVPARVDITAGARLAKMDGRRLVFEVEPRARGERVMSGRHERVIVDVERSWQKAKRERPDES